eukprot:TRINITY_DN11622_c0_g1_i1.p1 TRINITY_DN11622_c0_g1~~TRINITY_DN11622_c0_g1_i1.p1  ORF type:complete len:601 (-),score=126.64 TRINITY_DN11622_c0_g1_i1:136-1938(-)
MLARGELRCIGVTTLDEYRQHVEKDAAFERRFQKILVEESSVEDTISILRGLKEKYESHHGVRIGDDALVAAATLADRYISGRFLPDKAIDLIDEACAKIRVELDSAPAEIDTLSRTKVRLEVEVMALEKEDANVIAGDPAEKALRERRKTRLEKAKLELASTAEELASLTMRYELEKKTLDAIAEVQKEIEETNWAIEQNNRRYNLNRVAELQYDVLPQLEAKLQDLLDAISLQRGETAPMLSDYISPAQIADIVSQWTGIPVSKLNKNDRERLLNLGQRLGKRVIGQEKAVEAIANSVLRSRAGLQRPGQPTGSFLFLGPTGVGKTELAKALAEELFDDETQIVRIDMSEYSERHTISRLIGAPPGYVGFDEGGQLTDAVRTHPYSVVLLDEIEKAHPQVHNLLLQVLDDGRLTDNKGRTVDFSNTVFIATSNLGANFLLEEGALEPDSDSAGKGALKVSEATLVKVMGAVQSHFRPEFLNRLDDVLVFKPLGHDVLFTILDVLCQDLQKRGDEVDLQLSLTKAAKEAIIETNFDPHYGARPLKRFIDQILGTEISTLIVKGTLEKGDRVVIDVKSTGQFHFIVEKANRPIDAEAAIL